MTHRTSKESACRKICMLCQLSPPKHWFANRNMTSYCDVTNSVYPVTMSTIRYCSILELGKRNSIKQSPRASPDLWTPLIKTEKFSFSETLRRKLYVWPFAKKLYHGWITRKRNRIKFCENCPPEMKSWLRPWDHMVLNPWVATQVGHSLFLLGRRNIIIHFRRNYLNCSWKQTVYCMILFLKRQILQKPVATLTTALWHHIHNAFTW